MYQLPKWEFSDGSFSVISTPIFVCTLLSTSTCSKFSACFEIYTISRYTITDQIQKFCIAYFFVFRWDFLSVPIDLSFICLFVGIFNVGFPRFSTWDSNASRHGHRSAAPQHRAPSAGLHPADRELVVVVGVLAAGNVVGPVAEAHVCGGSRVVGQELQPGPGVQPMFAPKLHSSPDEVYSRALRSQTLKMFSAGWRAGIRIDRQR